MRHVPTKQVKNWTSTILIGYEQGSATGSWDGDEKKQWLFSCYGPVDLLRLGLHVGAADVATGASAPTSQTYNYWGYKWAADTKAGSASGTFSKEINTRGINDTGRVDLGGRCRVQECEILLKQNIISGFFAQAQIPLRQVKLDRLCYSNGSQKVVPTDATGITIDTFVKTIFSQVLQESKFNTNWSDSVSKTGVGDITVGLGWHGYSHGDSEILKSLKGELFTGLVLPTASGKDEDRIFSLPLGYNKHLGFTASGGAQGALFADWFNVGVTGSVIVFTTKNKYLRMKTDYNQTGWLMLEKGNAEVDQGAIWHAGGYIQVGPWAGLSLRGGYSFTTQEHTSLKVKDDNFLKTYVTSEAVEDLTVTPNKIAHVVSKDDIVNSDDRLRGWDVQMFHVALSYQPVLDKQEKIVPHLALEYAYPITGKRMFRLPMIGGHVSVSCSLLF
jgi:hypothetical protein